MDKEKFSIRRTPEMAVALFVVLSITIWTLQCSLLQSVLSIDIYETIVWGSQLQLGYSKHPPLSGWLGYFFSWVTGHADWGLYLGAQLCLGIGVWFSFKLARLFFDSYRAATAALMLYLLFFYTPSETKFSTYFVETAIAPMAAYALLLALREAKIRYWLIFGVLCALGILNKYSFGLIMLSFAIIVLSRRKYRLSLKSCGPYLAFAVFGLLLLPHVIWLVKHDFVCFRHVGDRLDEEHSVFMPLLVVALTLYPLAMELLFLVLSYFPALTELRRGAGWISALRKHYRAVFSFVRTDPDRDAWHFAAIFTLTPGVAYLIVALLGGDIILMWLSTTFSASGILLLALLPIKIDRVIFRRFTVLLGIFIGIMFLATTADSLCNTSHSLHIDPQVVVAKVDEFRRERGADTAQVIIGGLRYGALYSHYSPTHLPMCQVEDDLMLELYRESIRRNGALLIDSSEPKFAEFLHRIGAEVQFKHYTIKFSAPLGESLVKGFVVGYLPPGTEI